MQSYLSKRKRKEIVITTNCYLCFISFSSVYCIAMHCMIHAMSRPEPKEGLVILISESFNCREKLGIACAICVCHKSLVEWISGGSNSLLKLYLQLKD